MSFFPFEQITWKNAMGAAAPFLIWKKQLRIDTDTPHMTVFSERPLVKPSPLYSLSIER